jgi:bacterioferritin-associated ferredoxin
MLEHDVLLEASDPRAMPSLLRRLASHGDPAVRQAVAANPNTPTDALYRLAVRHPDAFLDNPLLELLILENPNLLAEMPSYARSSLLACENAPEAFLEWSEKWNEGLMAVLTNPNVPKAMIERLVEHTDERVANTAKLHVNADGEFTGGELEGDVMVAATEAMSRAMLDRDGEAIKDLFAVKAVPVWALEVLCSDSDAELRALAASHPDAPPSVLEKLAVDEEETVRQRAVAHKNAPTGWVQRYGQLEMMDTNLAPNTVERLAQAGAWARKLAARHPNAPLALIVRCSTDEDWRVREAAAQNPHLPPETLEQLSCDTDRDVRAAAAAHPKATVAQLERLTGDNDDRVRQAVAGHPNTPRALLEHLGRAASNDAKLTASDLEAIAQCGEWGRQIAAAHPNVLPAALERLSRDEIWRVRQAAGHNPNAGRAILARLADDSDSDVRGAVAQNPNVPESVLETLSLDAHNEVRKSVALNPHASRAILERLGTDDHWTVRQAVAAHPSTPDAILVTLARDADRDVRQAVIDRFELPEAVLETLFAGWFEPIDVATTNLNGLYRRALRLDTNLPGELLERLSLGDDWARLLAARHAHTPSNTLERLAGDDDWRVRQAVAQNQNAPQAVLTRLLDDHDADVRTAIAKHPRTPSTALEKLAGDAHPGVRTVVLAREDVPQAALEQLAGDEEEEVRAQAQNHPRVPRSVIEAYARAEALDASLEPAALEALSVAGAWARGLAARHPNTPQTALERLATDERWTVRQAVAGNPSAGPMLLESLLADTDLDVRRAVAAHPNTPQDALESLLNDAEDGVRRAALGNANLEPGLSASRRRRVIERCTRAREGLNRAIGLSHPDTPESELVKSRNLLSPEWLERLALALNPSLPHIGLDRLSRDGNRIVRAVARKRLEEA